MSLKRRFTSIGIGFFIFMLICTFLSRNFDYHMTPKIMATYPSTGYLSYMYQLSGVFMPIYQDDIKINNLFDYPDIFTEFIIIEKVYVEKGQELDAGDIILKLSLDPSLIENRNQLSKEYDILSLDKKKFEHDLKVMALNIKTQIHRIENDIYEIESVIKSLPEKDSASIDDEVVNSIKRLEAEIDLYKKEIDLLREEYSHIVDYGIMGDQSLGIKKQNIEEVKIKIEQIDKFVDNFNTTITAEEGGMILDFFVEEGQNCKAEVPLFTWIPNHKICLNVELPQTMEFLKTAIEEEEIEYMISYGNQQWSAEVIDVNYGQDKTTLLLEPEEELAAQLNISEIANDEIDLFIDYQTDFYDIVIPNSSIIEKDGVKMVYLIKNRSGFWGTEEYVVLSEITIEQSDAINSAILRGIQLGDRIVIGWDRPLVDDQKVIDLNQQ